MLKMESLLIPVQALQASGHWPSTKEALRALTVLQVNAMYDQAAPTVLAIPEKTPSGRSRKRVDQVVWSTVVREHWTTGKRHTDEGDGASTDAE